MTSYGIRKKSTFKAVKQDTVYTIMIPGGEIVNWEPTANFYWEIRPIYQDNERYKDRCYFDENCILLYEYTDHTGKCDLMSKDLKKMTPAIYADIEVVLGQKNVFFCCFEKYEYDEDGNTCKGLGELRNSKGEKIE